MAEIALGIVPLCLAALQGLVKLKPKLKVLRNYRHETVQLQARLDIQSELFRGELRRILLRSLDPGTATAMIFDFNHPQWQDSHLRHEIELYMHTKYDKFLQTVENLKNEIDDLNAQLSFGVLQIQSSKSTLKALQMPFKKEEYVNFLNDLTIWNRMLKDLREMANSSQDYATIARFSPLPSQYEAARTICSHLHCLLQSRASCDTGVGALHTARLLLSSTEDREPNVNLFFEHTIVEEDTYQRKCACNTDVQRQSPAPSHTTEDPSHSDKYDGKDLTQNMIQCKEWIQNSSTALQCSLGYLKLADNRRLVLYRGLKELKANCDGLRLQETKPLVHFLDFPSEYVITDKNRIKLGLTLVKSMLKHHSTAWWPQESVLKYVYAFCDGTGELSSSLDTLHLSAQLETIRSTVDPATRSCIIQDESLAPNFLPLKRVEEAMQMYGIRNLTLYNLGVDLLQIGLWEHVAWEGELEEIRSKVARLSHLGKKYRDAAKRLIDCDFGLASEQLEDTRLREAIFSSIVSDLEELLHQLTISGL
ncbi:hypothetical protein K445DRAFT_299827 [Daldinia sp. EC12]|nr:hypothetical protein K445DRAFT_299827 [Daldinia sp. EC12]